MFLSKAKLLGVGCVLGVSAAYCYKKHLYEKKLFDRINYLLKNEAELSGVYLHQRPPFGFLWYVQWLLPYHQSLVIVQKDGSERHVGLGRIGDGFFNRESGFILHNGEKYDKLNKLDSSIPIEAWIDYEEKFGHYPSNIDVKMLNNFTMTSEEASEPGTDPYDGENLHRVKCGEFYRDPTDNSPRFRSCRSSVMDAIRFSEICSCSVNNDEKAE